jgi:hypothetical protein
VAAANKIPARLAFAGTATTHADCALSGAQQRNNRQLADFYWSF